MIIRKARGAIGLMVLGSVVLVGTPTLAVEPDVNSPAGPELPAPRTDRVLGPESEGADPTFAPDNPAGRLNKLAAGTRRGQAADGAARAWIACAYGRRP